MHELCMTLNMQVILNASVCSRTRDVTSYNVRTGKQSSLPILPQSVDNLACTIFNNTITISGEHTGSNVGDWTDKVYQLQSSEWIELPSLKNWR